jgi:hypothetical protein
MRSEVDEAVTRKAKVKREKVKVKVYGSEYKAGCSKRPAFFVPVHFEALEL